MQFTQLSRDFYTTELFESLKLSYTQRLTQLQKSFTLSLMRIQQSQVLQEMKGDDLRQYRVQHMTQIIHQVLGSQQEISAEQYMRTISELKAQLSVQKMEMTLGGRKGVEREGRRVKELEEEVKGLRRELEVRESQGLGLEEMVEREIKGRMKMVEEEYMLREEHRRIVVEREKEVERRVRERVGEGWKEEREGWERKVGERWEGERRRWEEEGRVERERWEGVVREVRRESQGLKGRVEMLEAKNAGLVLRVEEEREVGAALRRELEARKEREREEKYLEEREKEERAREQKQRERERERERERQRQRERKRQKQILKQRQKQKQKQRERQRQLQQKQRTLQKHENYHPLFPQSQKYLSSQNPRQQKYLSQQKPLPLTFYPPPPSELSPRFNLDSKLSHHLLQKSRNFKQFTLLQDLQQLQQYKSRVKHQKPPNHYQQPSSSQFYRLQSKGGSEGFERPPSADYGGGNSSSSYLQGGRSRRGHGNLSPRWHEGGQVQHQQPNGVGGGGKFDEIQNSFAKELAELRMKMGEKRVGSPEGRRPGGGGGYGREESVKRRLQQTTGGQYSPKYTIKNYHHY